MSHSSTKKIKRYSFRKNPFIWGAVAGMVILPVLRMLAMARRDAPPPIVEVSDWSLFDFERQVFMSERLKGKLVFFNLYYNNCSAACEASFKALEKVSASFGEKTTNFEVLSIKGPLTDEAFPNPSEVEGRMNPNWIRLTGAKKEVEELIENNFKLGMVIKKHALSRKKVLNFKQIADIGLIYMMDQNGDLRIAIGDEPTSLAGFVRAGLFLLEEGPDA